MALIKLTDTAASDLDNSSLQHGYLYKDLFLDLETSVYYNKELNKNSVLKDVQGLFDENAVKNSITKSFINSSLINKYYNQYLILFSYILST